MSAEKAEYRGPDLSQGIELSEIPEGGMLLGHVGNEQVLLARRGEELFAIDALCTHYGGPLDHGIVVGETVRCPWHHACFSLRTGQALRAPALDPVSCWRVEIEFDPARQFARSLICFQNDINGYPCNNIFPCLTIHLKNSPIIITIFYFFLRRSLISESNCTSALGTTQFYQKRCQ